jgi:prepilin-type N-terminal cleavage/methylation domain-containing protein
MRKRGFTFVEILIVMVLIGIIASLGIPRIRGAIFKQNVRSARVSVGTILAKARAAAVQRGCAASVHFTQGTSGTVWITVCKPNTTVGFDTLGGVERIAARYSVTFTASTDSIRYMPNGIALNNNAGTTLKFVSSTYSDSVIVNSVGKVVR